MAEFKNKIGDLDVYPLALGGNVFGWTADREESFAVLDAYAGGGGNFVDTADTYSAWVEGHRGGESEEIIGEWLAARGGRDRMVLATKVGAHPEHRGLAAGTIRAAAEASLRRLRTDRIDLYYTHTDDLTVPVEEIITALDELVREGKVRHIGVSNIEPERLEASLAFSDREGKAKYVAIQAHYNLVSRDTYEGARMRIAREHALAAVPYYGLASGFLTGKYRAGVRVDSARAKKAGAHLGTERGRKVLDVLDEIAADRGVPVPTVALAWLLARPTVVAPIASARTVRQVPALLKVAELALTAEEVERLTAASA
ncbi:aldo/keto reductase [Actinomadura rugatobispora]|uniref:Aldo/keto reductase n=1 Tax=Actinomadura rugatobispora TaxID=1994 RepID=A0ABW1A6J5_9ACTN|nr:aldo/keto reductase [Actinomadura rugatobispora]